MDIRNILPTLARGAVLASLALAATANAQTDEQLVNANPVTVTKSQVVKIGRYNLAEASGRAALDRRLKVAAGAVCDVFDVSPARPATEYGRCYNAALTAARAQVDQRAASNDAADIRVSAI